jgi:hypothetical protein
MAACGFAVAGPVAMAVLASSAWGRPVALVGEHLALAEKEER